jgi:hypothetical protein
MKLHRLHQIAAAAALTLMMTSVPAAAQSVRPDPLVGTWLYKVYDETGRNEIFRAIQTYHGDGTLTEVSSLLPNLDESPAQGLWKRDGTRYQIWFILFTFDKQKNFTGYVRVRLTMEMETEDKIRGESVVDVIAPDGQLTLNVFKGPLEGTRFKLDPAHPGALSLR